MIPRAATYLAAGRHFRNVLAQVPPEAWDKPGLGEWNVRTLAGHTSRALVTVLTYLQHPAEKIDAASAAAYFVGQDFTSSPDVTARAVAAWQDLGTEPVAAVDRLLAQLGRVIPLTEDRVIRTIAGGMRLSDYLPTRIFELAVHSIDLCAACGIRTSLPADVEMSAATLAAEIAVARGDGSRLLSALTGRAPLPEGFSVV